MLDIPSISAVVTTIGVLVGVTLAYLEIRTLVRTRKTDLVTRLYSTMASEEWLEAWEKVNDREIVDYTDYKKKHGLREFTRVSLFFELVGILLHSKLIEISLVRDLFGGMIKQVWEKMKTITEGRRKQLNRPEINEYFEYLYNEMQKREQRLQQTQQ